MVFGLAACRGPAALSRHLTCWSPRVWRELIIVLKARRCIPVPDRPLQVVEARLFRDLLERLPADSANSDRVGGNLERCLRRQTRTR